MNSNTILCFCWNDSQIPLCESYLDNKTQNLITRSRGIFSKTTPCYNPLFFDQIEKEIVDYSVPIEIIVFSTEGELESGTWFHSDFLPSKMNNLSNGSKYKLLTRDKYAGQPFGNVNTMMRMSIFVRESDKTTQVVELSKGNTLDCKKNNKYNKIHYSYNSPDPYEFVESYTDNVKVFALYVKSSMGNIAFITVQYVEDTPSEAKSICFKTLEDKFIVNKNLSCVFIMGDFANNYSDVTKYEILTKAIARSESQGKLNGPLINEININYRKSGPRLKAYRKNSIIDGYNSGNYNNDHIEDRLQNINYFSPASMKDYENLKLDINTDDFKNHYESTYEGFTKKYPNNILTGYHDRILHKAFNVPLVCDKYKVIRNVPTYKDVTHFGVLGIYRVPTKT